MSGKVVVLTALLSASASAPVFAEPAPENEGLRFFVKAWKCEDLTRVDPGSPEVKVRTDYKFKETLGGSWFSGTFEQRKQKDFPGFAGEATFGWDGGQKKFVLVGFDNAGGWINLSAPGAGDTVAWTGDLHVPGANGAVKFTWTKKGEREATFVIESQVAEGKWMKLSDASCKIH